MKCPSGFKCDTLRQSYARARGKTLFCANSSHRNVWRFHAEESAKAKHLIANRSRVDRPPEKLRRSLLRRYRLSEHKPVSVQIHDVEVHHAVLLSAELTRDFQARQGGILLIERFHIVCDDVNVPGVALASPRIVRRRIALLLLQEDLNLVTAENRKTRGIVLGLEPEPLVPLHRRLDIADQKHCRRVVQFRPSSSLRGMFFARHGPSVPPRDS